MHGRVSPPPARRQPESAKSLLTPQQQWEKALKIIQPQQGAKCEAEIATAIEQIRYVQTLEKGIRKVRQKAYRDKLAKKLRNVERAGAEVLQKDLLERVRDKYEFLESWGKVIKKTSHASGAKTAAATWAYILLADYSHCKPALTNRGPRHRLAAILYGYANTGSFNFDYLKYLHEGRWPHMDDLVLRRQM